MKEPFTRKSKQPDGLRQMWSLLEDHVGKINLGGVVTCVDDEVVEEYGAHESNEHAVTLVPVVEEKLVIHPCDNRNEASWNRFDEWRCRAGIQNLRTVVFTSPPWNVLAGHGDSDDAVLTKLDCIVFAGFLNKYLSKDATVILHLPPSNTEPLTNRLVKSMEENGWVAFKSTVVQPMKPKNIGVYSRYQLVRNYTSYVIFHRANEHPPVAGDCVLDMTQKAKEEEIGTKRVYGVYNHCKHVLGNEAEQTAIAKLLAGEAMNSWQACFNSVDGRVPDIERVVVPSQTTVGSMKKGNTTSDARIQQLSSNLIKNVMQVFARKYTEQESVLVVDPFAGSGSTGFVAKMLDCWFYGMEVDQEVAFAAQNHLRGINYETGSLLIPLTKKISEASADTKALKSPSKNSPAKKVKYIKDLEEINVSEGIVTSPGSSQQDAKNGDSEDDDLDEIPEQTEQKDDLLSLTLVHIYRNTMKI